MHSHALPIHHFWIANIHIIIIFLLSLLLDNITAAVLFVFVPVVSFFVVVVL
jgi:hypothetical protein